MISLKIGNEERRNGNIEERWVAQQFRKRNGQSVCVKMIIREGDVNLPLTSGACSNISSGGGRPPNRPESKLIELWDKRGLNNNDISAGNLISFLKQYEQFI